MITTNDPYERKVGLSLSHSLFKNVNKDNLKYLDVVFRQNEREAIGRRTLIMIYILEGFSKREIIGKMGCGSVTITEAKKVIKNSNVGEKELLNFLIDVYYDQFEKKISKSNFVRGSRTVSGTKAILGIDSKKEENKFVPLY